LFLFQESLQEQQQEQHVPNSKKYYGGGKTYQSTTYECLQGRSCQNLKKEQKIDKASGRNKWNNLKNF
jgi:hypothetical protein